MSDMKKMSWVLILSDVTKRVARAYRCKGADGWGHGAASTWIMCKDIEDHMRLIPQGIAMWARLPTLFLVKTLKMF